MDLTPVELGGLVAHLESGDAKATAYAISALIDRHVKAATQQSSIADDQGNAYTATRLPALIAETNATRALDTDFVIDPTAPALASYTVELVCTAPFLGQQTAQVDLNINGASKARALLKSEQLLGVAGLGIKTTKHQTLTAYVPAGVLVTLTSTLAGGGTAALISSTEVVFTP